MLVVRVYSPVPCGLGRGALAALDELIRHLKSVALKHFLFSVCVLKRSILSKLQNKEMMLSVSRGLSFLT